MTIGNVVADANVLLAAAIGKAALRVLVDHHVEVHVTRFNVEEVESYFPRLARKYGIPIHLVEFEWRLLPKRIHEPSDYEHQLERARLDLAYRDPDDAHPLALARTLELPVWSNVRDLAGHGPTCLDTATLLAMLDSP